MGFFGKIGNWFKKAAHSIGHTATAVFDGVKHAAGSVVDFGKKAVPAVYNEVKGAVKEVYTDAKDLAKKPFELFGNPMFLITAGILGIGAIMVLPKVL